MMEMLSFIECLYIAVLGGLLHLCLCAYETKSIPSNWEIFGHIALPIGAGYLFWLGGFPNHLNVFFAGFFAVDFIRMLARKYKPAEEEEEEG